MNMSVIVKMMSIIMCMNVYNKWLCYSQDDVNYYVYACLYYVDGYMCEGVVMIMCIYVWSYVKV